MIYSVNVYVEVLSGSLQEKFDHGTDTWVHTETHI